MACQEDYHAIKRRDVLHFFSDLDFRDKRVSKSVTGNGEFSKYVKKRKPPNWRIEQTAAFPLHVSLVGVGFPCIL